MTGAKMILHDWQRGRIPFFVPPPKLDDKASEAEAEVETTVPGIDPEAIADNNQAAAALKAIAGIMSSQQQKTVPVQRDFYDEKDLENDDKAKESTETDDENRSVAQEDDQDAVSEDGVDSEDGSDDDAVSENEEENESDSAE